MSITHFFLSIGFLLDGSLIGKVTSWRVGMSAVGEVGKRHPIGIYSVVISLLIILSVFLLKGRIGKENHQRGVLGWWILMCIGFAQLILAIFRQNLLYWESVPVETLIATVMFIGPMGPLFVLFDGKNYIKKGVTFVQKRFKKS